MECLIRKRLLRWAGHLARMDDGRLPKAVFFGELADGNRHNGRPRFKDAFKTSPGVWDECQHLATVGSRPPPAWRSTVLEGTYKASGGGARRQHQAEAAQAKGAGGGADPIGFRTGATSVAGRAREQPACGRAHSRVHRN